MTRRLRGLQLTLERAAAEGKRVVRFELSDDDFLAAVQDGRQMMADFPLSLPVNYFEEYAPGESFRFMGVDCTLASYGRPSRAFVEGGDGRGEALNSEVRKVPVTGAAEAGKWRETSEGFQALSRPLTPGSDEPSA